MSIPSLNPALARSGERPVAAEAAAPAAAPARAPAAPVETANAVAKTGAAPDPAKVKEAVDNINKALPPSSQELVFSVDSDSNRTIVKVVDQKTNEVIRQIPSEEALEIAKALDNAQGLLIKQTA
jgi:flagellar protein FlaG